MVTATVSRASEQRGRGLAELYERHAPAAVRLAYLITGDRERSRDVAQEAFVRVAARFRHLRFPDAFDAYLRRTVVNLCTSQFRRDRLEGDYVKRERERSHAMEAASYPPDLGARDELVRALRRLPARQRAAVVLRYYEDLSEEAMADAMHVSVPAARSLLSRGMKTLRTMIDREDR
jgi:RNA polymerase sigma-70 factor (sigma-E family)